MSSNVNPDELLEYEMEEAVAVLAEALENDDEETVKGLQKFWATNWTVVMTPGQIIRTLIRMHLEDRDWFIVKSDTRSRSMKQDEKEFVRYLKGQTETGIEYLEKLSETGLIEVRLLKHIEILIEDAEASIFTPEDKQTLRRLDDPATQKVEGLHNIDPQNVSQSDVNEVENFFKTQVPGKWNAIKLKEDLWGGYLNEMSHEYDERINTRALGNLIGISVRQEGKSVIRPLRWIVTNHSGDQMTLSELREAFMEVGAQDRFDQWLGWEQGLRDELRLLDFEDGLKLVTVDKDRTAYRAWEQMNNRAQQRVQQGTRSP